MKKAIGKSHCPINFALETFGDSWSLLIIRDIVFYGKKTYGEFLNSEEGVATNILATRLTQLEKQAILKKSPHPQDKRKDIYTLTEKGLNLIPLLLEISRWSSCYDPKTTAHKEMIDAVSKDREKTLERIKQLVRNGEALYTKKESLLN